MDKVVTGVEYAFINMRDIKNEEFMRKLEELSIMNQRCGKMYDAQFSEFKSNMIKRWKDMDCKVSKKFSSQVSENYRNTQDLKRLSTENNNARLLLEKIERKIKVAEAEVDIIFDPLEGEDN